MLKFFRKIRQNLIEQGRVRRYLVYAFGEILLVVIGILIALQINAWNQRRLDRNKEYFIIQGFQNELQINEEYIKESLADLERNVKENGLEIIKFTGPEPKEISEEEFLKLAWYTSRIPPFTPKIATFLKLINSEDFNLIQSDSMKTLLIEYEANLNWIEEDYDGLRANGQVQEQFETEKLVRLNMVLGSQNKWEDIFGNVTLSRFKINPNEILSDPSFENIVVEALISYNYVYRSGHKLLGHIDWMQAYISQNY